MRETTGMLSFFVISRIIMLWGLFKIFGEWGSVRFKYLNGFIYCCFGNVREIFDSHRILQWILCRFMRVGDGQRGEDFSFKLIRVLIAWQPPNNDEISLRKEEIWYRKKNFFLSFRNNFFFFMLRFQHFVCLCLMLFFGSLFRHGNFASYDSEEGKKIQYYPSWIHNKHTHTHFVCLD